MFLAARSALRINRLLRYNWFRSTTPSEEGYCGIDITGIRIEGLSDILETLARLHPPEEIPALRLSPALQERISTELYKLCNGELSADEERDWQKCLYIEHLVPIAKARVALQLKSSESP